MKKLTLLIFTLIIFVTPNILAQKKVAVTSFWVSKHNGFEEIDLDNISKFYEPNKFNGTYSFNVEQCYHYDVQYYKSFTLSSGKVKEVLIHAILA